MAVGLLSWLSVFSGQMGDALEMLGDFERSAREEIPRLLPNLRAVRCRYDLYLGKRTEIEEWMREAPNENEDFCSLERLRYLTKIRVYIQEGKNQKAYGLLQKLSYYAEQQQRIYIRMEVLLLSAILRRRMGAGEWKDTLQACITQAESYHFVRLLSREGGAVLELLEAEPFVFQDASFKAQVFAECRRMAAYYPAYLKKKGKGEIVLRCGLPCWRPFRRAPRLHGGRGRRKCPPSASGPSGPYPPQSRPGRSARKG